jgi:type VI secretion system protein ImpB
MIPTEVELPLKLLVMGDFTLSEDERALEDREPVNIDKDNFDDVLKEHKIKLDINVPNKISGKQDDPDNQMSVSLKFDSLKDFGPEAIIKNTEKLNELLELRDALKSLKGPLGNVTDFRKKIQETIKDPAKRDKLLGELGINKEGKEEN